MAPGDGSDAGFVHLYLEWVSVGHPYEDTGGGNPPPGARGSNSILPARLGTITAATIARPGQLIRYCVEFLSRTV